jgi:hypothetical protein
MCKFQNLLALTAVMEHAELPLSLAVIDRVASAAKSTAQPAS